MANLSELWESIAKNKLDWAYEANKKFLESVSHDAIKHYLTARQNKKLAILYGKSQVGKTTLILTLMGVREDMLKEVEDVLRAGRKAGKSSTSTAIKYGYSVSRSWQIDGVEYTKEGVVKKLEETRNELASNPQKACETEININIPEIYFSEWHDIEIIDLPGVESSDDFERQWVPRMIGEYLMKSNLTIVVTKANDLQDIKSFKLHESFNWYDLPGYTVVATHTYGQESIRSKINTKIHSKQDLYDMFKVGSKDILSDIQNVYPLDFGDSFAQLKRNYQAEYKKIKPIREKILSELRRDILESHSEYEKLTRNFKIYQVLEKNLQNKRNKLGELKSNYKNENKKLAIELEEKEKMKSAVINKIPEEKETEKSRVKLSYDKFKEFVTNESLQRYKDGQRLKLLSQCHTRTYCDKLIELYKEVDDEDVDGYFWRKFRDDKEDKKTLEDVVQKVANKLEAYINSDIERQNVEIRKKNTDMLRKYNEERDIYIKFLDEQMKKIKNKIKKAEEDYQKALQCLDDEIGQLEGDKALNFGKILSEEYNEKYNTTMNEIKHSKNNATVKLLKLAFLKTLENEYNKLKGASIGR